MPYKDPERKKEAARRWFEKRGGYAAEIRERRSRMTPEQRDSERERDRIRKRKKRAAHLTMTLLALILTAPAAAAPRPDRPPSPLTKRIDRAKHRTHACQHTLGLKLTPSSGRPIYGHRYARWVLTLWATRAQAYCSIARQLTDTGILREIVNPCLGVIVGRETAGTWSPTIYNYGGSGAYGLPQALPGHKMASAGEDWRTNPLTQLRWMVGYTTSRYGSPCGALAFHNANGWY